MNFCVACHLKPPMAHAEHRHGSNTDEKPLFMRKRRFSISTVPRTIRLMFLFGTGRQSIAKDVHFCSDLRNASTLERCQDTKKLTSHSTRAFCAPR